MHGAGSSAGVFGQGGIGVHGVGLGIGVQGIGVIVGIMGESAGGMAGSFHGRVEVIPGNAKSSGDLLTVAGSMKVGAISSSGAITASGNITTSGAITASGPVTASNGLAVAGSTNASGPVTASNGLTVSGGITVSSGDVTLKGGDVFLSSADCAEDFTVLIGEGIEPGTVMVIDDGITLRQSSVAYDRRVAGVVSGAGGFRPGITLDRQENQTNRMPVALLGKVYCKVDAQFSPIEVGDLLTTSPTAGHAMRALDHSKAFGSVLGKALGRIELGTGLIPILVTLQ